jgi:hypothetical protein
MTTNAALLDLIVRNYHKNSSAWRFRGDSTEISEIRKYLQSLQPNDPVSTDVIAKLFSIFSPKIKAWNGSLPLSATLNTFSTIMDVISGELNIKKPSGTKLDLWAWQFLCNKFTSNSLFEEIRYVKAQRELPETLSEKILYVLPKSSNYVTTKISIYFKQEATNRKTGTDFEMDSYICRKISRGDALSDDEKQTIKKAIDDALISSSFIGVNNPMFWDGIPNYLSKRLLDADLSKFSLNNYLAENNKSQENARGCVRHARDVNIDYDTFEIWKEELMENERILYLEYPKIEKKLSFHDKLIIRNLPKDTERMAAIRLLCIMDKLGQLTNNNATAILSTASAQFLIKNDNSQSRHIIALCEKILTRLQHCQLLTFVSLQEALPFWKFFIYNHDIKRFENSLNRLPNHLLTQDAWNEILRLCSQPNTSIYEITTYIDGLIAPQAVATVGERRHQWGATQSTHAASVEDGATLSLRRLNERYPLTQEKIDEAVKAFEKFIEEIQSEEFKYIDKDTRDAAVRGIEKLIQWGKSGSYQEKYTHYSLSKVLALVWTGLTDIDPHIYCDVFFLPTDKNLSDLPDDFSLGLVIQEKEGYFQLYRYNNRQNPPSVLVAVKENEQQPVDEICRPLAIRSGFNHISNKDFKGLTSHIRNSLDIQDDRLNAKARFISEICNVQRAYNTNSTGADLESCPGGTFNGLVNALNGIHTDVKLALINNTTISNSILIHARKVFGQSFLEKMSTDPHFKQAVENETQSDDSQWQNKALQTWYNTCLEKIKTSLQQECHLKLQYTGLSEAQIEHLMTDQIREWIETSLQSINTDKYMLHDTLEKYQKSHKTTLKSSLSDEIDKLIFIIEIIKDTRNIQRQPVSNCSSSFYPVNNAKLSEFFDIVRTKDINETINWLKENNGTLKPFFHQAENALFNKDKPFGCACFDELQSHLENYGKNSMNQRDAESMKYS